MESVRRGAGAALRYLTPLYALAVLLQFFFAGSGIFGLDEGESVAEEGNALDLHRDFGWIISNPVALLILLIALLWWPRRKRMLGLYFLLFVLMIVQSFLPEAGQWVAALHPVNAVVLLALLGYLSYWFWRGGYDTMDRDTTRVAAPPAP